MSVEIGTVAAQCPEKEYINGIFAAAISGAGFSNVILHSEGTNHGPNIYKDTKP